MMEDNHNGEVPAGKRLKKEFSKCPGCGSTARFYEGILAEMKGRGLIDQKVNCFDFQVQQGFPLPPQKMAGLPFGAEVLHFEKIIDTCCNCGLDYAVKLAKVYVKKSINLAQPPMPLNRAGRRRLERLN